MVEFTVVAPSRSTPSQTSGAVLQQDNWNDYSFQTLYHLYAFSPEFSGLIGPVKILRRGQTGKDTIQLPVGALGPLEEMFCSLGQSLDYYERLAELPEDIRRDILTHLRDALAFPEHVVSFFDEPGWKTSVLRDIHWETFRRDASVLLERDYNRVARLGLEMSFQVAGWTDPLHLRFDAPHDWRPWVTSTAFKLPERIAVIAGRNGSGKSTLLARLARVLHASQRDRASEALLALGKIDPPGIGFTRILNVAYSAFDAFQVPGLRENERQQIAKDMKRGSGRYHFCGLRDIARELDDGLDAVTMQESSPADPMFSDRQNRTLLKSIDQLSEEFERTIEQIFRGERHDLFRDVVNILATDPSFQDLGPNPASLISGAPRQMFMSWSTGHKIVMHATASMVAYTEAKSIVLIDEPEGHLHPPLLASFMHAVRLILEKNDAFAVVATHSPVVAQETLALHIAVVRRNGSEITIRPPRIETYGESIGEITNEVFGLNSDTTDFHTTLHRMVNAGMDLDSIEGLFERGLSLQARAYVMSRTRAQGLDMWTLPLPNVNAVDQQLTMALTYANGQPVYVLSASERAAVLAVYNAYDALLGQPDRDLLPAILGACRQHIATGYDQVQVGARLAALRATLLAATGVCPYCGFGEPTQLDHFLPKTIYGELSIYPRNLVPSCGPCNNAKRTDFPGAKLGSGLIHPYFQTLPDLTFMRADVTLVAGALDVTFRIETGGLDPGLAQMLQYQLVRMKLNERYPRQINKFLSEQRVAILMFKEMGLPQNTLAAYFARSATSLAGSFGVNDWRPALIVSLAGNPDFCAEPEIYLGSKALVDTEGAPVAA